MATTPPSTDGTLHHHLGRRVLTRITKYTRDTDRSPISFSRCSVPEALSVPGDLRWFAFPVLFSQPILATSFLLSPLFSFFSHSRYSSNAQNTRTDGTDARREMRDYEKPGTQLERQPVLAFSVLLSIRRCTLPGGKTPTRSRAHPSSTLARLYTQGVHTTTVIPSTPYGAFPLHQSHPPASFTPLPKLALFEPLSNPSTFMKSPHNPRHSHITRHSSCAFPTG